MTEYRDTQYGQEKKCPQCGEWAAADYVDNGIGLERCGPFNCEAYGWVEIATQAFDFCV